MYSLLCALAGVPSNVDAIHKFHVIIASFYVDDEWYCMHQHAWQVAQRRPLQNFGHVVARS